MHSLWDWRACSLVFYKAFVGASVLCDHKRKERYMASELFDAAHWGQNPNEVTFAFLIVSSLSGSMISYCNEAKFGNAINCLAIHSSKKWSVLFLGSRKILNQCNFEFMVITNCIYYGITNHKLLRVQIISLQNS